MRNWLVSTEVSVSNVGIRFRKLDSISIQGWLKCCMLVSVFTKVVCDMLDVGSILTQTWVICWFRFRF